MLLLSLALSLLSINLSGQIIGGCPTDMFKFEIEKVSPTPPSGNNWKANSTLTKPGAFHAFYRVKLKAQNGNLPFGQFTFNYLRFDGLIDVNNFTSRINVELTEQFSQGPYLQYLDLNPNTLGNGEVVWEVGIPPDCDEPSGEGVEEHVFNLNGQNSITLFTICIEAVAGDPLQWTTFSAFVEHCSPLCEGGLPVIPSGGSTLLNFPAPPAINHPMTMTFEYGINVGSSPAPSIKVMLQDPVTTLGKMDALIHIEPHMLGFSDLDFAIEDIAGGPNLIYQEKRKNTDGTFDIYISFIDFPDPNDPNAMMDDPQIVCALTIVGPFNASQGGNLDCSLTAGRWALGPMLSSNGTTYPLRSTPSTVNIPGYALCDYKLAINGTGYQTSTDCSVGVRFELTHISPQPIELSSLKLHFIYDPVGSGAQGAGGNATPGAVTSTLPNANTSGSFGPTPNGLAWQYVYDHQGTIFIENGMYVDVPFQITRSCIKFLVLVGEAVPAVGVGGNCALNVILGERVCDPLVRGSVFLPNILEAPYYRVTLKDFDSPYDLEEFNFCEPDFSFCPDDSYAPFYLEAEMHPNYLDDYLCVNADNSGVTTYDLVLIQKHVAPDPAPPLPPNPPVFTSIYQKFAADANGDNFISRFDDIPEFRKLILGIYDNTDMDTTNDWDNPTPSWRYIREDLNIPVPPFKDWVPIIDFVDAAISNVPANGIGNYGNFYAVKLGDVNYTCNCNNLRPSQTGEGETNAAKFSVQAAEIRQEGKTVFVPVYADASFDLVALQGGFRFDPSVMDLIDVLPNPDLPVFAYHFGLLKKDIGEIRFGWSVEQDLVPLPGKALLFTLQFELKPGVGLPEGPLCWASDNIMKSFAYQEDGTEHPVRLHWEGRNQARLPLSGLVVSPNPFEESMTAFIYVEKPQKATVQLSDNWGTIYARQSLELQAGDNVVQLRPAASAQPGVYFLTIEAEGQRLQRRVVKM